MNNKKKKNHSSLCTPRPACAPSAWVSTRKVECPAGGGGGGGGGGSEQSAGRHQALLEGTASLGPGALLILVLLVFFILFLLF